VFTAKRRKPLLSLPLRRKIVARRCRNRLPILAIYPGGRCSWSSGLRTVWPLQDVGRSLRENRCCNSPPQDRRTACATHARHEAATPVERRSGPAETGPVGPSSSGASTSAPGRGRALGRAGDVTTAVTSELRRARLFQADVTAVVASPISEPETALPLTIGKQGAEAAQRRPRCSASS